MHITALGLLTNDLLAQRAFYATVLELSVVDEGPTFFTVQAGATRLTFTATHRPTAMYHLAFNIPRATLAEAKAWLSARVALVEENGRDEVYFPAWDARASYFYDAAGNLLEVIDRRMLAAERRGPFGPEALLCVSEIGLPVDDVAACVAALTARLRIAPYRTQSATFAPLGDEEGLILVAAVGRPWTPAVTAAVVPVSLTVRDRQGLQHHLPRLPDELLPEP
jgi:catechol 2,3-dioxygenase-like lactoylglutathione lyase family enzyme